MRNIQKEAGNGPNGNLVMVLRRVSLEVRPRGEDVQAVVAVMGQQRSGMVTPEMLPDAGPELPDLVASLRTLVRVAFEEVARKLVDRLEGVAAPAEGARHFALRRLVVLEKLGDEGEQRDAERLRRDGGSVVGRISVGVAVDRLCFAFAG